MSIDTIFTAKKEHLRDLNPTDAEDLFRELLRAETLRLGPENFKINVPRGTNATDGGIDATVDTSLLATQSDIIVPGKNGYQIKSGKTFRPWLKSEIKKELFKDRTPLNKKNLGERIRACLDADGTYILVCTGIHLSKSNVEKARSHIEKYLKEQCEYENPKVKVWSQPDFINFLDEFPLLTLGLRGLLEGKFKSHWSWSKDEGMQVPFVPGESQEKLIAKIQNELRQDGHSDPLPVWGNPGIGKTRLVLKATEADDLSPRVIYYRSVSHFRDSTLMSELLHGNNQLSAIVVIDGCDPHSRTFIPRNQNPQVKLVTISNDRDGIPRDVSEWEVQPLDDKQIRKIIQRYKVPEFQSDRHTDLCSGSPFMAHHIGRILADFSGDASKVLSEDYIYEQFYIDFEKENQTDEEVKLRRRVLRYIALFKQFGFEADVSDEARVIAEKVKEADGSTTPMMFQEIVADLRKGKILKGEFTLQITPKALHIKLWKEWWDTYGRTFDLARFTQDLPSKLRNWFYQMFKYAAESKKPLEIVKDLLGPNGPFQNGEHGLINLNSDLFLVLAEADPESALECLKQTIGKCDRETLLRFTWRRNVVWALEKIAVWQDLFADAARLLLALGEAENETWSNNASGVFAELFSPAYGIFAPTEASPVERLPILQEAFESESKPRHLLALEACKVGLQSMDRWGRSVGAEYQGLRKEPKFWKPQTYGELWSVYKQVWQFLFEQLDLLSEIDEREVGVGILLENASQLVKHTNLSDMVADTIQMLSEKTYVDNRLLIKTVVEFLHHNGKELPDDIRQRWEDLKDELIGSDFHSLMRRYVGTNLPVDAFDENKNYFEEGHPQIHVLAQQAVEEPRLLQSELQWLVTAEAHNGYAFGYQLGKRDNGFSLLPTLLNAQRNAGENASAFFLGGYFRALFENNATEWEEQLDALVEDTKLNVLIPDLTYHSGITDRAGLRLLKLAEEGVMHVNSFAFFFGSRVTDNLSDEVFTKWITFLLNCSDNSAVPIALKLYYFYYVHGKQEFTLPRDLTFQLLVRPARFENLSPNQMNSMTGGYWTDIANAFLNLHPEKDLEFIEQVLPHFGKEGTIFGTFNTETCSVLTELTKRHPEQVWKHVSKRLEERDFFFEKWLKEGDAKDPFSTTDEKGVLTLIPHKEICEWIDEDVEDRSWYFAYRLIPKTFSEDEWRTSLVRAFLMRYGQREDVRRELHANYATESWTGERSLYLESKKDKLLRIKTNEDNANVKRWLNEFIDGLEEDIERARIDEEREF